MTKPTKGPLTRECPRCHQPPGKPCHSANGKPLKGRTHQQRLTGNPNPPPNGQPPLLTPERQDALTDMLNAGTTLTTAATALGIGISTLHHWIAQGQSDADEDEPYRVFREAVAQARARGNAAMARNIFDAGMPKFHHRPVMNPVTGNQATRPDGEPLFEVTESQDWRAHSWTLERAYSHEWGRRQTLEITGDPELAGLPDRGGASELANRIASRLMEVAEEQRTGTPRQVVQGEIES